MGKRKSRYLTFDGQFEELVLGAFRIIRGFADLKNLAEISVSYTMQEDENRGGVTGQQRTLDPIHAQRIKRYLESGQQRFLPEVILSVRTELTPEYDRTRKRIPDLMSFAKSPSKCLKDDVLLPKVGNCRTSF
jgi:hypothetical protein